MTEVLVGLGVCRGVSNTLQARNSMDDGPMRVAA